jgi:hypothetical protein
MAKNRRGGYRQPNKPAAVATPQGGQRTDGGPGSKKQPLRRLPDADYGQNKEFVAQQQAAPLPVANNQVESPNIFAPTERPGEPVTTGLPIGEGVGPRALPDNTDVILQAMYQINPSSNILEIINNRTL